MTDDRQREDSTEDRSDPAHSGTGGTSSGPQTGTGGRGTDDDSGVGIDNAAQSNRPGSNQPGT